jgi:hypothetical protein
MRYFYWEPGVSVADFGPDRRSRAEAVLASATIRKLLGASAGDGFAFQKEDEAKPMVTFQQVRDFQVLAVDEAQAAKVVVAAYEAQESAKGEATAHLDQGLRVRRVGLGERLVYSIHVERNGDERFSRPFMFVVDAQSGEVIDERQAWIE